MADQKLRIIIEANDKASKKIKGITKSLDSVGQSAGAAGRQLAMIGAPVAIAGALAIKTFVNFESAFTGVRKTVDASEAEFQAISDQFRQMAQEIPVTVNELSRIGEAAGQLGIQAEDIVSFTRVMADLGVTTNLTSDEAATAMARIANVTGLSSDEFENLGSALVDLGNNMATTEGEILHFATRIAATGDLAGLTQADILAIGAAMTAVGVQAEAGGTAVQKVLISMTKSAATGGKQLDEFARVAGVSSGTFKRLWKDDASEAFTLFIEGLKSGGDEAFTMLEELGLADVRAIRSLLALSNAGDQLRNAFTRSNKAFADNNALANEAALRYGTAASKFSIAKNQLTEMGIVIGQTLTPGLLSLVDAMKPVVKALTDAAEANPKWIKTIALATVALGALVVVLLTISVLMPVILISMKAFKVAMIALKIVTGQATLAQYGLNIAMALNPVGLIVAGVIALIAAFVLFRDKLPMIFGAIGKTLDFFINNTWAHFINLIIDGLNFFGANIDRFESNMEDSFRSAGEHVEGFIDGVIDAVNPFDDATTQMVTSVQLAQLRMVDPIDGMVTHIERVGMAAKGTAAVVKEQFKVITSTVTEASKDMAFSIKLALSNLVADYEQALRRGITPAVVELTEKQKAAARTTLQHDAALMKLEAAMDDTILSTRGLLNAFVDVGEELMGPGANALVSYGEALGHNKDELFLTGAELAVFNDAAQKLTDNGMANLIDAWRRGSITLTELAEAADETATKMVDSFELIGEMLGGVNNLLLAGVAGWEEFKDGIEGAGKALDTWFPPEPPGGIGQTREERIAGMEFKTTKERVEGSIAEALRTRNEGLIAKAMATLIEVFPRFENFIREQLGTNRAGGFESAAQNFGGGGIVQGPIGSPQKAIVHGGERILTPGQQSRGGGITVLIEGPVYGFEDFGDKVSQAIQEGVRRGQYAGVLVTE